MITYVRLSKHAAELSAMLLLLLLFSQQLSAQPARRAEAYRLFEDSSSNLKLGYLHYPILAQTAAMYRNKSYAKNKIITVVIMSETKSGKDTVSVTHFNKKGLILRKDSFYLFDGVKQHLELSYEYTPKENKVKEKKQYHALQPNSAILYRYESAFWFDKADLLVKSVFISHEDHDTLTSYFENDSPGILKKTKTHRAGVDDDTHCHYSYTYDEKGRVIQAVISRSRKSKHALEKRKRALASGSANFSGEHDRYGFSYDDQAQRVNYYYNYKCTGTDLITRSEHLMQDHCCPDKEELGALWRQQKITFDTEGRIHTLNTTFLVKEELCEQKDTGWDVQTYIYTKDGLLSAVTSDTQKLTVHYLKK